MMFLKLTPLLLLLQFHAIISNSVVKIIGHFKKDKGFNSRFVPLRDGASAIPRGSCFITELHVLANFPLGKFPLSGRT